MAAHDQPNIVTRLDVPTVHGTLNVTTSLPISPTSSYKETPDILLIHGNSSSSQIFSKIFFPPPPSPSPSSPPATPLASTHRLIAFDLPGHGASTNAPPGPFSSRSPAVTSTSHYSMPSYASAALAVLDRLQVSSVIVFGHSLGGHVGIELLSLLSSPSQSPADRLKGLMITGTPPVPRGGLALGFKGLAEAGSHMGAAEAETLSEEEVVGFAGAAAGTAFGGVSEPFFEKDVRRTDGRARKEMFAAFRGGEGVDQRETLEGEKRVVVAVVNGGEEPFVDLDYCDGVKYGNLWRGKCVRLEGLGHSPFWEKWDVFEPVLREFVDDVTNAA